MTAAADVFLGYLVVGRCCHHLPVIQRQLGHANLRITSVYLQGIDTTEIIDTVHARRPPTIPAQRRPQRPSLHG